MANNQQRKSVFKISEYSPRQKWIIVAVMAIFICCAVGGGVYISMQQSAADKIIAQKETAAKKVFDTKQELDTKANNGDVDGALIGYDKAILNAVDDVSKRNLLIDKSVVALNNNKLEDALKAAQSADKIKSNYNTVGLMATIYDKMGNVKMAIEYYQKAANDEGEYNYDKSAFQARATELQKSLNE
jgi:tetratricopeptide (TPR) repeat protein